MPNRKRSPKSLNQPWHTVFRLKDELRTGELTLAEFAADLHEVTAGLGRRPIYEDPAKFFALTYPTLALRELVKDVAERLAGQSAKAVRQLELTYGGGKTHTLITLHHLFQNPNTLPDVPAVQEFRQHIGPELPQAFTASLCFDKIDVDRGIEGVRSPDGETRTLKHPWSVLAFQLAGADGLRAIHADGEDVERETPPAEPLLVKLLERPQQDGLATLILVDEVLMYARGKVGVDPNWSNRIVDFFQYLVQAVTKVDRAALVASLLATDPRKQSDELGKALQSDLFDVFRRQREEGVLPVGRDDVAEVLRRRFFDLQSIGDSSTYQSAVVGIVGALAKLDETIGKNRAEEEARFLKSFPFHPDLTDVFYSRWTQLEGFQRTRGILRTLATALRNGEGWDLSPLIGPATLLAPPDEPGASDAVIDLAGIATSEKIEGRRTEWRTLLEAELGIARRIQEETPALASREMEQAVITVFLYSQPIGHKANTPELIRLIGANGPDAIELDKGLGRWRDRSWFLDDADIGTEDAPVGTLPKSWRLGNRPNLKQMHDEACAQRVTDIMVDERLGEAVGKTRPLTEGAKGAGAKTYTLPLSPHHLSDNGVFCYAILGADAASDAGRPSAVAQRFINETTGPNRPRVHRNMVVLAVPSRDGLAAAREAVRSLLGWEDVRSQLADHAVDALQEERLRRRRQEAERAVPDTIRAAWNVVVTVNAEDQIQAFKLPASGEVLFTQIKADERSRIKETAVDAQALLPEGPYELWREEDDARYVSELASAFARYPHLPKMLKPRIVLDTIIQGIERGFFVARLSRPDGSVRTWWREALPQSAAEDPQLQVVLPEKAELVELTHSLLAPGTLPNLWATESLTLGEVIAYFETGRTVTVQHDGYDDVEAIPLCPREVVIHSISEAVESGLLWLTSGPASIWSDPVPDDVLQDDARLRARPDPIAIQDLTEEALPSAWRGGKTSGVDLERAVSQARGEAMPWGGLREAIQAAVDSRWLQLAEDSESLNCAWRDAGKVVLEKPEQATTPPPAEPSSRQSATLEGPEIQELAELIPELMSASAGHGLKFQVRVLLENAPDDVKAAVDRLLRGVNGELTSGDG